MFFARQGYFLFYVFFFCRQQHTRVQLHVSNFLFPTHRYVMAARAFIFMSGRFSASG